MPEPSSPRDHLKRNDAEIAGALLGFGLNWHAHAEIGSPEWAVEKAIQEQYGSLPAFVDHMQSLSPEKVTGWVSLIKGAAAEHLVAYETGAELHEHFNQPLTDATMPDGTAIQIKVGTEEYIRHARAIYPDDVPIHSSAEGAGIHGVTAHGWGEEHLERVVRHADKLEGLDSVGHTGFEIPGLGAAALLSGVEVLGRLKSGKINLEAVPVEYATLVAKRTIRVFLVGKAIATGSPILVSAATGYLIYRNRRLVEKLCGFVWAVANHDVTISIAKGTCVLVGNVAYSSGKGLVAVASHEKTILLGKKAGTAVLYLGDKTLAGAAAVLTHPTTQKTGLIAVKSIAKAGWFGLRTLFRFGKWLCQ